MTAETDNWISRIRQAFDNSHYFQAYDLSREAQEQAPDDLIIQLMGMLALVHTGAINQAKKQLAPIVDRLVPFELQSKRLLRDIQTHWPKAMNLAPGEEPSRELREGLANLARDMVHLGSISHFRATEQRQVLDLLGRIYFRIWQQQSDDHFLRLSHDYYTELFRLSRNPESGINAALMSRFLNDTEKTSLFAREILSTISEYAENNGDEHAFKLKTIAAEAALLLDEPIKAEMLFEQATQTSGVHYSWRVDELSRLRLMQRHGIEVSEQILSIIRPPTVVIFAGHPLDAANVAEPCFPAELESSVKREIHAQLDALDADIGYCAAGAGSDILFIEAMLERDAEVHIVLPCNHDDYIRERVAYAGSHWERRCRNAIQLATSIRYTTEEHLLGHDNLFRFNNVLIEGLARIKSELMLTEPRLLVVWDALAQQHPGSGSDFMDQWADIKTLHIIQLDELREERPQLPQQQEGPISPPVLQPILTVEPQRVVKAMLFVDIVGFSKLTEESLPQLWRFLGRLNEQVQLSNDNVKIDLIESWGDALYVVSSTARTILEIAFSLKQGFEQLDIEEYGFGSGLDIRVGLHSGPVFVGTHPFTAKPIVYGSHVSRAARIEPITVPGEIFASQQFVAMLSVEEQAVRNESDMTGEIYSPWYHCEYVGTLPLAKAYGTQPIYHISDINQYQN